MNYFELFPDEKILEICEQMDNTTLNNFIQSNTRFYNICQEIVNRRLKLKEQQIFETIKSQEVNYPWHYIVYDYRFNMFFSTTKTVESVEDLLSIQPKFVIIPELKIIGYPEIIRYYLLAADL